jgi:ATP-dependent exoDNAse (exonuclease V) alpha subunit
MGQAHRDSRNMAMLTAHAYAAGAKLILVGDDRQLSSIERGGMFGALKDRYGAAELAEVRRQHKNDDRRAAELMAEGNFHGALARYDAKGAIHWTRTQDEAREALVAQWAKDNAADPSKSRFVFAYTNDDVNQLNRDIRQVRKESGELEWQDHTFETKHGRAEFSARDRVQFTGTDKQRGLYNGQAGTVQAIDGSKITVRLDGRGKRSVEFDAKEFQDFSARLRRHDLQRAGEDVGSDLPLPLRTLAIGRELCRLDPASRQGRAVRCPQHRARSQRAGPANGAR